MVDLEAFFSRPFDVIAADPGADYMHEELLLGLEDGTIRAAERRDSGEWVANAWVKGAILAGFRRSNVVPMGEPERFFDKSAYPPRVLDLADGIRFVPGGSSIRRGAHLDPGVVIMPPAYVNVGAFVAKGTMVDSHALVGSCAQIGERVHLSAAAQVGGVLEPAGARPVIVEDDAFIGALAGVFEGVIVRARAVLAAGVVLTGSTPIFDLVRERIVTGEVPEGAVVVPGVRRAAGGFALEHGLGLAAPVIVKYRDAKTDAKTALEAALR